MFRFTMFKPVIGQVVSNPELPLADNETNSNIFLESWAILRTVTDLTSLLQECFSMHIGLYLGKLSEICYVILNAKWEMLGVSFKKVIEFSKIS